VSKVKYKGVIYRSRKALCKAFNQSNDAVTMRMARGDTLHQAITFKPKCSFRYSKTLYTSKSDLIKKLNLGITLSQFEYRLKKCGGSVSKAIRFKPQFGVVEFKGVEYRSLKNMCDKLGLRYGTILARMKRDGLSVYQAVKAA